MTAKLIEFHVPTPRIRPNVEGKALYGIYREERIRQGWEEFLWESLSEPQQLVWNRIARRLN